MGDYILAAAIIILFCGGLAYISYRGYKKSKRAKRAKEATVTRLGATMSGTLKHVSGLPLAKGLTVEMFYGPEKITFKKDGQEINIARERSRALTWCWGTTAGARRSPGPPPGSTWPEERRGSRRAGGHRHVPDNLVHQRGAEKSVKLDASAGGLFPSKVAKDFQKTYRPKREKIDL